MDRSLRGARVTTPHVVCGLLVLRSTQPIDGALVDTLKQRIGELKIEHRGDAIMLSVGDIIVSMRIMTMDLGD